MPYLGNGLTKFTTADDLTVNGDAEVTGTVNPSGDTASGDAAAVGFTSAEGLILTGQGSTNDVTIKNDADADVLEIPTGTTNVTVAGNLGVGGTVTGTGTSIFASLDISGDIDVDGTTNLDAVDIDGAVDINGVFHVSPNTADKDTFELSTNAVDEGRLRIKNVDTTTVQIRAGGDSYFNGGDVSIGTTSPDARLHVLSTSLPQTKIAYDSTRYMNIEHATIYNVRGASQSNSLKIASRGYSGGNDIIFATGGTDAAGSSEAERMRILAGGNIDISAGHIVLDSGYGILFSSTGDASGATSNLFDDYEEGTWTPVYQQGTSSATYSTQSGRYTKIGNRVFFTFQLDGNSVTGNTSHLYIGGLPFTSGSASLGGANITYTGGVSNDIHVTGVVFGNQTNIGVYKYSNGGSVLGNTMALNGGWVWAGQYTV